MIAPSFVTTATGSPHHLATAAIGLACRLHLPYIPRGDDSMAQICATAREQLAMGEPPRGCLVFERGRLVLRSSEGDFSFHPNMSVLRIQACRRGGADHMVRALALEPGTAVLDCTLGLASDAIVTAYATGAQVVGLEASPVIFEIVRYGLEHYASDDTDLDEAMARVRPSQADHLSHMKAMPDGSVDCVYFDPMFRRPAASSSAMGAMRDFAKPDAVSPEAVREALRIARRRVVLKETRPAREFSRLGFETILGGRHSEVAYGVIEI